MELLLYFAQVSLYALIMWSIYLIVWRNRPLHTYSRAYLLISLVIPVILPLIHFALPESQHAAIASYGVMLPPVNISPVSNSQLAEVSYWPGVVACIYVAGGLLLAAFYTSAYIRLNKKLINGRTAKYNDHTIITNTGIGPGTIGRRIFFPSDKADNLILRHELAHIRAGHRYDSLLLQMMHILFWASPANWLIGRELKMVHEFEADQIATQNVDTADYASLLLSQSFGTPHTFIIAHSFFHHPLKRRIMMLQKIAVPKRSMLLFTAVVLTIGFTGTVLLAQTKKSAQRKTVVDNKSTASNIDMDVLRLNTPPRNGEIRTLWDGGIAFKTVDEMPQFNGSYQKWIINNMHFPDSIRASKARGCLVQFTVAEDGQIMRTRLLHSSGDQELDQEAVRVISSMPAWKPGIQKGNPVPVIFTMPISFNAKDNQGGC